MYVIKKTMGEGVDGVGGVDGVDGVAWYTIWFRSSNGWEEKRVIVLKAMLIICPPEHKCAGQTVGLSVQFPVTVYKCSKDYVVMQLTKVETRIN